MQQQEEKLRATNPAVIKATMRKNIFRRLGTANELAMKKRTIFFGESIPQAWIDGVFVQTISAEIKPFLRFCVGLEAVRVQCAENRLMVHQLNKLF